MCADKGKGKEKANTLELVVTESKKNDEAKIMDEVTSRAVVVIVVVAVIVVVVVVLSLVLLQLQLLLLLLCCRPSNYV